MKQEKPLKLTNDILFQRLFGKIGNENITKGFLEKILGIEIEDLTLDTNKRLIGKQVKDKIGRIDVKANLKDGTKVIIEMQVSRYTYMAERLLYYWAQTYAGNLKRGKTYQNLKKTIVILISVENLSQIAEIPKYHTEWEIREREYADKILTDNLQIHIIELGKFKEGQEEKEDANWIRFIKAKGVDELEKLSRVDEYLKEAKEELDKLTADPELRELYEAREAELIDKISEVEASREEGKEEGVKQGIKQGIKQGMKRGKEEGKKEGIREKQKEVVMNMRKRKMSIEEIAEIVNLSMEEVEKIIREKI